MYLRAVLLLAKLVGGLSRALGQGNGVMVAGRTILKLSPNAVGKLSRGKRIILISGTNGKSTTSKLIAVALGTKYSIAHNHTGANLFAGVAAALGEHPNAKVAVLEVDELVIPWAIENTKPELLVLLNLGRDQLDRLSEVRIVSSKWRSAIGSEQKILASTDDPFVVYAASASNNVIWFSAGESGHIDAATCPNCGAILHWEDEQTNYWCNCGFKKPEAQFVLSDKKLNGVEVLSSIPGNAALQNAARALIVAKEFAVHADIAQRAISSIHAVDGRFAIKRLGDVEFRILLSKNPASWRETLMTSAAGPKNVLLIVNANTQDGKDTSWLWDVDFKPLSGRNVLVTGDRRLDVSARLTVENIPHQVVESEFAAAGIFGSGEADLIASYTAFHRLVN